MRMTDMKDIHAAEKSSVGKVEISDSVQLSRATIEKKFKAANPTGNQKSAAATAWIMANHNTNFIKAPMAWAGRFSRGLGFPFIIPACATAVNNMLH